MRFRVYSSSYHGRKLLGVYPDLSAAFVAAACSHPGENGGCRCGGGFLVALIESPADRALISPTGDGARRYCFVPTDVGISIPMLFVEAETAAVTEIPL